MTTTPVVGFNSNDFFYQNVNAPIKFDNQLCGLSNTDLKMRITSKYNLSINPSKEPKLDNRGGQCILTKMDTSGMNNAQKLTLTKSWKLQHSTDSNGRQSCNCVADNTYISSDPSVFSTQFGSPVDPVNYYSCANSSPDAIQDSGINTVNLDPSQMETLIDNTVDYYNSVCRNKELADKSQTAISNSNNYDQKYQDAKLFYNREYLNRINLGIGIFTTCGLIYYTST
jgi:hypothetical protein